MTQPDQFYVQQAFNQVQVSTSYHLWFGLNALQLYNRIIIASMVYIPIYDVIMMSKQPRKFF